jgi:hypothetical protein
MEKPRKATRELDNILYERGWNDCLDAMSTWLEGQVPSVESSKTKPSDRITELKKKYQEVFNYNLVACTLFAMQDYLDEKHAEGYLGK